MKRRKACVLCRLCTIIPGFLVYHILSSKPYVQHNTLEMLVKSKLQFHILLSLLLLIWFWFCVCYWESWKRNVREGGARNPCLTEEHLISCILPFWKTGRVSEDDNICFSKWQHGSPIWGNWSSVLTALIRLSLMWTSIPSQNILLSFIRWIVFCCISATWHA